MRGGHSGTGVLRGVPDFRRYWIGQAASTLGSAMSVIAYPLLVLFTGGGAARAGAIASVSLVVRTVCRIPAGALADRYDRRRVMVATDLIRAASVGTVPVALATGHVYYGHLVAVAVVEGVASAVFYPAAMVAIKKVVPADLLTAALSRNQARMGAVGLAGPALGGFLFTVDHNLPFTVDALTYLVSAVMIARITADLAPEPSNASDRGTAEGLRWILRRPVVRNTLLYLGTLNLTGAAAQIVIVVSLTRQGVGGTGIGAVLASAGVGAVLGALISPWLVSRCGEIALVLGAGGIVAGGFLVFAVDSSAWVIGPMVVVMMLLTPTIDILLGKMLLTLPPEHMSGRVLAASGLVTQSLPALGPLTAGVLVGALGVSPSWLVLGTIAAAATATAAVPMRRRVSEPEPVAASES